MEEQTTDAVIHAPEATFGIPMQDLVDASFGRKAVSATGDWTPKEIPTREEIERIEAAAAEDDDIPDAPRTVNDDDAIDLDPYGWIAGVEAAHPDFAPGQIVPKPEPEHVLVWQHAMIEPHRFDRAVAKVQPNGALLVTRPGSDVPLKGYAPGVWVTFEHIGAGYHRKPQPYLTPEQRQVVDRDRARAAARPGRVQTTRYAEQERAAISMARSNAMLAEHADEMVQVFTDPMRRTPPTHEFDADDTQTIPAVRTDEEGGGVEGPKARGAREGAETTGQTPRLGTGDPETPQDEKTPGRLRSLWLALRNPDWDDES